MRIKTLSASKAFCAHAVVLVLALIGALGLNTAQALIINATFDSTITNNPNAVTIMANINQAIGQLQSSILNPITVNITFQDMNSGLGQSSTAINNISYSQYLTDLQTHQTLSAQDLQAVASLQVGPGNPVNGNTQVTLTLPLLRALGEAAGNNAGSDSTIGLNLSLMNFSRTGPQDPSKYDLQQVALHEINEVLGAGGSGSTLGGPANGPVGALDLFRYSAAGVRSYNPAGNVTSYFSINNGVTNRSFFNQDGSGDYADWSNAQAPQVQDAFSNPGNQLNNGPNELTSLDVIGYNLIAVPEPGTISLLALGIGALAFRLKARRKRA